MSVENPPAFPRDHRHNGHNGMNLRDWFAGQALAGLSSAVDSTGMWQTDAQGCADRAYEYADAMLRARSEPQS